MHKGGQSQLPPWCKYYISLWLKKRALKQCKGLQRQFPEIYCPEIAHVSNALGSIDWHNQAQNAFTPKWH